MSEAKHTPGPWVGFMDSGKLVAIMPAGSPGDICLFAVPPSDVDGDVMIAAPDMLAALQVAERYIDAVCANTPDKKKRRNYSEARGIVRAAIAKATGAAL